MTRGWIVDDSGIKRLGLAAAITLTLLLGPPAAHAGWFTRTCASLLDPKFWVDDDPTQFEDASDAYVKRKMDQLHIRIVWGKATAEDRNIYNILQNEMSRREQFRLLTETNRERHEALSDH